MSEQQTETQNSAKPKSARTHAREFALQGLYQWLVAQSYVADLIDETIAQPEFKQADKKLFNVLMRGVTDHEATLIEQLTPHLDRPWAEVTPIEKSVLLIGAYELVHMTDTPFKVSMNEAIELAKTFGGAEAHRYVNGILEKLAVNARGLEVTAAQLDRKPSSRKPKVMPTVTVKPAPKITKKQVE
jgi:transcription antitermination protein NusB